MADHPNTTTTATTADTKHDTDPVVDNNAVKADAKPSISVSESAAKNSACKKHPGKNQDRKARNRVSKKKSRNAGKSSSIATPSDDSSSDGSSSSESTSSCDSASEDDSSSETSELEIERHSRRRRTKTRTKKNLKRGKKNKLKLRRGGESATESDVEETEQDDSFDEKQLKKLINRLKVKKNRILNPTEDSSEDQQFDDADADLVDMSLALAKDKLKSKQPEGKRIKLRGRRGLIDPLGDVQKGLQRRKKKAGSKMAFKRVDQCICLPTAPTSTMNANTCCLFNSMG
jgi:hypothetical protein